MGVSFEERVIIVEENKRLCREYPFLIPRNVWTDKIPEDWDYEYTELDEMPDGWRKAFGEQMCAEIRDALLAAGGEKLLNKYRILQIKEKYGSLRWYDRSSTKEIDDIIRKYELLSAITCVACGKPATRISKGWICPWCDECGNPHAEFEPLEGLDNGKDM